jgi:hypothetical protein
MTLLVLPFGISLPVSSGRSPSTLLLPAGRQIDMLSWAKAGCGRLTSRCSSPGRQDSFAGFEVFATAPVLNSLVSHHKIMGATGEDDWEEVWDARADALARVLGPGHDRVFHAPHPFALGGHADVVAGWATRVR